LKAGNAKDWEDWTRALQKASNTARGVEVEEAPSTTALKVKTSGLQSITSSQEEEREWEQVEAIVSRIVGIRDAVRRLSKSTAAPSSKKHSSYAGLGLSTGSPNLEEGGDYLAPCQKRNLFGNASQAHHLHPISMPSGEASHLNLPSQLQPLLQQSLQTGPLPHLHVNPKIKRKVICMTIAMHSSMTWTPSLTTSRLYCQIVSDAECHPPRLLFLEQPRLNFNGRVL